MKIKYFFFSIMLILLSSCSNHQHNFKLKYNNEEHYLMCFCGESNEFRSHQMELKKDEEDGIMILTCSECGYTIKDTSLDDTSIKNQLLEYNFSSLLSVPGSQLSYNFLLEGYDTENKYGPKMNKENRLYTYLTEYLEEENGYHLLYIEEKSYEKCFNYLIENQEFFGETFDCFSKIDEKNIIDGKILYAFQQLNLDEQKIKYIKVDTLENIEYSLGEYQLIFCAKSKKAIIKENVSLNKKINKFITLYNKVNLIYNFSDGSISKEQFDTNSIINYTYIENMFNQNGEYLEVFPNNYEIIDYSFYPLLGMKNSNIQMDILRIELIEVEQKKYLILPRYLTKSNIDLLDEQISIPVYEEDIFREYKEIFKEAFYQNYDIKSDSYIYGLYEYDKVKKIIRGEYYEE